MTKLWELRADIRDAIDLLRQAARRAYDLSGAQAGRAAAEWTEAMQCPGCGGTGYYIERLDTGDVRQTLARCSGCDGTGSYRIHCSDPGEPAVEGWPAMVKLSGDLDALAARVEEAFTPEIRAACAAEDEDDREPIAEGDYHYYRPPGGGPG